MTGPEVEASSVALAAFKRDESKADLENYRVSVREHPKEFEVIFIPNQPPLSDSEPNRIILGGATIYGREVHYFVSKDKCEILRRSFAR
jgi:hypothetical protein